jgi:cysteine desulfurase
VDPAAAFAAAVAYEQALERQEASGRTRAALVERIRSQAATHAGVRAVGDPEHRLPHVVTLAFDGVDGEALATELDRRGVAVGTGSACSSSTVEPSHVLTAMGVPFDGSIRITLDAQATAADVEVLLRDLGPALETVRGRPDAPGAQSRT